MAEGGWKAVINLVNQMALSQCPGMAFRSLLFGVVLGSALVGCTSVPDTEVGPPRVEIADLVAAPEKYEGMRIRIEGWAVRSFEDYNLYPSRAAACDPRGKSIKVGAEWDDPHLTYPSMRKGVFDATFRDKFSRSQPDGSIIISTANVFWAHRRHPRGGMEIGTIATLPMNVRSGLASCQTAFGAESL